MEYNFEGRTALVTGAAQGIGRELTKKLINLKAKVVAVSRNDSKLESLAEEVTTKELLIPVCVDLGCWAGTEAKLLELCQSVDLLVNNAGYCCNFPIVDAQEDELDKMLNVNLKSPINLIKMVAPGMKRRKQGSIVNVSSVASLAALDEHIGYAASKAALDMVTKISAKELGPYNVRVNSINPTVIWTQMGREHWSDETKRQGMMSKIPMGRFVEVDEAIDPILFLLSDRSSMINGALLPIDGGFLAT